MARIPTSRPPGCRPPRTGAEPAAEEQLRARGGGSAAGLSSRPLLEEHPVPARAPAAPAGGTPGRDRAAPPAAGGRSRRRRRRPAGSGAAPGLHRPQVGGQHDLAVRLAVRPVEHPAGDAPAAAPRGGTGRPRAPARAARPRRRSRGSCGRAGPLAALREERRSSSWRVTRPVRLAGEQSVDGRRRGSAPIRCPQGRHQGREAARSSRGPPHGSLRRRLVDDALLAGPQAPPWRRSPTPGRAAAARARGRAGGRAPRRSGTARPPPGQPAMPRSPPPASSGFSASCADEVSSRSSTRFPSTAQRPPEASSSGWPRWPGSPHPARRTPSSGHSSTTVRPQAAQPGPGLRRAGACPRARNPRCSSPWPAWAGIDRHCVPPGRRPAAGSWTADHGELRERHPAAALQPAPPDRCRRRCRPGRASGLTSQRQRHLRLRQECLPGHPRSPCLPLLASRADSGAPASGRSAARKTRRRRESRHPVAVGQRPDEIAVEPREEVVPERLVEAVGSEVQREIGLRRLARQPEAQLAAPARRDRRIRAPRPGGPSAARATPFPRRLRPSRHGGRGSASNGQVGPRRRSRYCASPPSPAGPPARPGPSVPSTRQRPGTTSAGVGAGTARLLHAEAGLPERLVAVGPRHHPGRRAPIANRRPSPRASRSARAGSRIGGVALAQPRQSCRESSAADARAGPQRPHVRPGAAQVAHGEPQRRRRQGHRHRRPRQVLLGGHPGVVRRLAHLDGKGVRPRSGSHSGRR